MKKFIVFLIIIMMIVPQCVCFANEEFEKSDFEEKTQEVYGSFSFESIISNIKNALVSAFKPSFPVFLGLLGLILIASVLNCFNINFSGFDIGGYVSCLCLSGYCFSVIKSLCENLSGYTEKLRNIMAVVTPTLISSKIGEGAMSAKTGYFGLVVTLTVSEFLITEIVLPCVKILFVLSLVSCMCKHTVDLRAIASSIRTFSIFSVSLVMTGVVTVMHFQNVIARAADSVGLRAIRFVSTSFIPIVGGLVGESVKTVTESLKAVRGIMGAAGVAAIISVCLPPIAAILIYKTELAICVCLAKTLGCKNEADILSDAGGILNILNAALLAATIGFAAMICIVAYAV